MANLFLIILAKTYSNVDNVSMTEIVNLNKARKQRAKQAGLKTASQNRIKFGLTKQVRDAVRREQEKQGKTMDALRLDPDPDQKA